MVVKFIISSSVPLSIVDNNDFKEIIKCGFPTKNLISRPTLMKYITEESDELINNIKQEFDCVKYIATTVDCWSIFKK